MTDRPAVGNQTPVVENEQSLLVVPAIETPAVGTPAVGEPAVGNQLPFEVEQSSTVENPVSLSVEDEKQYEKLYGKLNKKDLYPVIKKYAEESKRYQELYNKLVETNAIEVKKSAVTPSVELLPEKVRFKSHRENFSTFINDRIIHFHGGIYETNIKSEVDYFTKNQGLYWCLVEK